MQLPTVIYEDNHLLVVNKPAGIPTAGVVDRPSVHRWACDYLKRRYAKPGNVYVGIVSRLDTVTSGVLVLARTSKAAARLSDQIRNRTMVKRYAVIAEGHVSDSPGSVWIDEIYKDDGAHRMRVLPKRRSQSSPATKTQHAELRLENVNHACFGQRDYSAIMVTLVSGRKHQIRVQFAARNHAVWGDRKYAASTPTLDGGIGLHAASLRLQHPTTKQTLDFTAPPPTALLPFWPTLGLER
jgi:23S rRNA pseudouridine1911/1915/1917 synthase